MLGLAAVGAPETTPIVASAADVETTATVSNYNVMFGGGDYGDAVAINIDTTDDFSVWFASGGPTITPVAPYATMYDGYGTPDCSSWSGDVWPGLCCADGIQLHEDAETDFA